MNHSIAPDSTDSRPFIGCALHHSSPERQRRQPPTPPQDPHERFGSGSRQQHVSSPQSWPNGSIPSPPQESQWSKWTEEPHRAHCGSQLRPSSGGRRAITMFVSLPIAFPLATAGEDGLLNQQRLITGRCRAWISKRARPVGHVPRHLRARLVFLSHRRRDCRGGAGATRSRSWPLGHVDVSAGVQNLIRFHVVFPPFAREAAEPFAPTRARRALFASISADANPAASMSTALTNGGGIEPPSEALQS